VPRSDWHMLILYSCDLWGMTLSLVKRPAWCHSTGMLVWRHMEAGLVSDTAGVSGIVVYTEIFSTEAMSYFAGMEF